MSKGHLSFLAPVLLLTAVLPGVSATARAQETSAVNKELDLKAAVVLDKDFCLTKMKKNHETFEVGKAACEIFKPELEREFSTLTTVGSVAEAAGAQAVFVPRFVDLSATKTLGAFSTRELTVLLEWTVKDSSGRTVWIQTVEGTGKNHMGNGFTYQNDLRQIIRYALGDLIHKSVAEMNASRELHKLEQKP